MDAALIAGIDAALNTRLRVNIVAFTTATSIQIPVACLARTMIGQSGFETQSRAERLL
jgi:hypothetical protein